MTAPGRKQAKVWEPPETSGRTERWRCPRCRGAQLVDASSGAEPPYDLHAPPIDPAAFKEAWPDWPAAATTFWSRRNAVGWRSWGLTDTAPPTYRGGLTTTACAIDQRIDAGSHTIFIVTATSVALTPGQPLVAHARSFQRLAI